MSRWRRQARGALSSLASLLFALLAPIAASGQTLGSPWDLDGPSVWQAAAKPQIPKRQTLDPITVAELTFGAGGGPVDLGTWSSPGTPIVLPPILMEVERDLERIWRIQAKDVDPAGLDVSYQLIALNGRLGYLSHGTVPQSEMRADLDSWIHYVVNPAGKLLFVEGRGTLRLELSEAVRAGDYSGTLLVTINNP